MDVAYWAEYITDGRQFVLTPKIYVHICTTQFMQRKWRKKAQTFPAPYNEYTPPTCY